MDKLVEKTVKANLGCIYNSAPLVKYPITQMKRDMQNLSPCLQKYKMSKVLLPTGKS